MLPSTKVNNLSKQVNKPKREKGNVDFNGLVQDRITADVEEMYR